MDMLLVGYGQYCQDAGLFRIVSASFLFLIVGLGSVIDGPLLIGSNEIASLTKLRRFLWCFGEATCEATGKVVCLVPIFGMMVTSLDMSLSFSDLIGLTLYSIPLFIGTLVGRWAVRFENSETNS